ncbi:MAG: uroporphyrinogen-III synthase [Epsilonproteobacteria bacterium]|nr:MAG: uroporphyrinogen-III synthase [Campylobacterota bacterium]
MISFSIVEQTLAFEGYELLMFTSKQAVVSADKLNPNWKEIPCLAIGSATAKQIEVLGGTVQYQPKSFYGETLSHDIVSKFKGKKILYLRPKEVSFNSKDFLQKEGIFLDEKIIYETACMQYTNEEKPDKNAIIIFTSPSSIHCFLKNFEWDKSYVAVVIGEATKKHLPVNACYEVADTPLIDACITKATQLLLTSNSK